MVSLFHVNINHTALHFTLFDSFSLEIHFFSFICCAFIRNKQLKGKSSSSSCGGARSRLNNCYSCSFCCFFHYLFNCNLTLFNLFVVNQLKSLFSIAFSYTFNTKEALIKMYGINIKKCKAQHRVSRMASLLFLRLIHCEQLFMYIFMCVHWYSFSYTFWYIPTATTTTTTTLLPQMLFMMMTRKCTTLYFVWNSEEVK